MSISLPPVSLRPTQEVQNHHCCQSTYHSVVANILLYSLVPVIFL